MEPDIVCGSLCPNTSSKLCESIRLDSRFPEIKHLGIWRTLKQASSILKLSYQNIRT